MGQYGKARKDRTEKRRSEAIARQQENINRGFYMDKSTDPPVAIKPVPISFFERL